MEERPIAVSQPALEYIDKGVTLNAATDFKIVKAIFEHPDCAAVRQVWFQVGPDFTYNALSKIGASLLTETVSKKARLPDIPPNTPDDAFVVLVIDAGMMRRLAEALKR